MTIGVVVKSPEGVVLAADSVLTIMDKENHRILDLYRHSKKVHQIGEYPIGVIAAGTASIGERSLESYIIEFSNTLKKRKRGYEVKTIARLLTEKLQVLFEKEGIKDTTDLVCAGYSPGDNIPDVYLSEIPNTKPERFFFLNGRHTFNFYPIGVGGQWIHRWYFGFDNIILEILEQNEAVKPEMERIREDLKNGRLTIPVGAMPLQDTIDFAVFLINVAIGSSRFTIGPATCGGDIDVVAITKKDGFIPLKVKQLEYKREYGSFA